MEARRREWTEAEDDEWFWGGDNNKREGEMVRGRRGLVGLCRPDGPRQACWILFRPVGMFV